MTENSEKPSWKRRALGVFFNRRAIANVAGLAIAADLFAAAGYYGAAVLNSNEYTRPAAAWYNAAGDVLYWSGQQVVSLGSDLNDVFQKHYRP